MTTMEIIRRTRAARSSLHTLTVEDKNRLLLSMAQSLRRHTDDILAINARDIEAARGKISDVMLDRLRLDEGRVAAMADGLCAVAMAAMVSMTVSSLFLDFAQSIPQRRKNEKGRGCAPSFSTI